MAENLPQHIMLFGITQRCGTNYMYSLLDLHEEIQTMDFPGEDFLLHSAVHLGRYVYETSQNWHPMWGGGMNIQDFQAKLAKDLGTGLLSNFLIHKQDKTKTHLISKTPDTRGLAWAPVFFPNAKIIFLVRNPVATIESGRKSFGWTYSQGIHTWKASARRIINMSKKFPDQTTLVKYEDLIEHKEDTVNKILDFLNLDHSKFHFKNMDSIKLKGSSRTRKEDGKIDWSGETTTATIAALKTRLKIPEWLQRFILTACKKEYEALGYGELSKGKTRGVLDWIRYSSVVLPETVINAYRSGSKAIQSSQKGFRKWCKNQLGLEIETLH